MLSAAKKCKDCGGFLVQRHCEECATEAALDRHTPDPRWEAAQAEGLWEFVEENSWE